MRSGLARIRQDVLSPALFPFLAVMVCTIGALVFILTIAVTQASQSAKAELEAVRVELQAKADYVEVATDQLQAQRTEIQEQIDRARNGLAHLEDHIERIRNELQSTQEAIRKASEAEEKDAIGQAERESRIDELKKQAAMLQEQLTEKLNDLKTSRPAFSIIPYAGPNGTARRPIYLECVAKGVIIQPEGIMLSLDDLKPPHGPGNPLDASLRAIRSKLQEFEGSSFIASPYPLLLVRPDGIASYALARAAMMSWDDQHGYELIDADMPLAFPKSLPGLNNHLERVIADARLRQKDIIAAIPRSVASSIDWSTDATDLAIEHGDDAPSLNGQLIDDSAGFVAASNTDAWQSNSGKQSSFGSEKAADQWAEIPGTAPPPELVRAQGNFQYAAAGSSLQSMSGPANGYGQEGQGESENPSSDASNPQSASTLGSDGANTQSNSSMASQTGAPSNSFAQASSGQSNSNTNLNAASVAGATTVATTNREEQMSEKERQEELAKQDDSQPNAVVRPASNKKQNAKNKASIASEYGEDWAVQRRRLSSTPIHRSISIRVSPDRWTVVDGENNIIVRGEILLADGPKSARQKLRSLIEDEVEDWGVAVSGGYWVPIIKIYSQPNSEWATQQLTALLDGSGAKIEVLK